MALVTQARVLENDVEQCVEWLRELERGRDLTAPLDGIDESAFAGARTVCDFVAGLRAEMLDFRQIVEAAAEVAALNAAQLERIAANTAEQSSVVERTAAAITEIDQGAAHVARMTEDLRGLTGAPAGDQRRDRSGALGRGRPRLRDRRRRGEAARRLDRRIGGERR